MANVKGTMKQAPAPKPAARRGHVHKATIERLNGGGFKTTVHFRPHGGASSLIDRFPEPVEAAHKNYKAARRHLDGHFSGMDGEEPIEDSGNGVSSPGDSEA